MDEQTVEPGKRPPAPGALRLVQEFVNTVDLEGGSEDWDTPEALRDWLAVRGLIEQHAPVSNADLSRAIAVREALRATLLVNTGEPFDPAAIATLNHAAGDAPLTVRFDGRGSARLEPAPAGVAGALGRILAIVYTAMSDGSWSRLKACRRDICRWAFWDASKNHSGAWCSMAVCGNRTKVRAYQQRHRTTQKPR